MGKMLVLSSPNGPLSARRCTLSSPSPLKFVIIPTSTPYSYPFSIPTSNRRLHLTIAKADGGLDSASATKPSSPSSPPPPPPPFANEDIILVGQDTVPLEGVIQFEKPNFSSRLRKWGRLGLLAGGDVLALLLFSAIGRFSHGFPLFSIETLRTADPFIAGWFLSAYFLGGYSEDGRGKNGLSKAVIAAAKSWAFGIPLGLIIRAATLGHIPPTNFILVTMGSTAVLLVGWRTMLVSIFPNEMSKRNDVYRRGSPFELFELLTSLVRRW